MAAAAAVLLSACASSAAKEAAAPAAPVAAAPTAPPPTVRTLTQLAGDVYRWQAGEYFGVVMVTDDGIVIADMADRENAEWLKGELATRFPGKPVKYILYSHHHYDHVSGAGAFPDARVIAQADAKKDLQPPPADAPLEGFLAGMDTNKDGKIDKTEASANPFVAPQFDGFDLNKDGFATPAEIWKAQYADVRMPDGTFNEDYTLKLGGKSVHMMHVGGSHASDMVYMIFPGNVLFVVDVINIKRLPFGNLSDYDLDDNFRLIDLAAKLKPAIITPGHGMVGNLDDLANVRQYFTDLIDGVKAGIAAGKSLEQIQAELTLDKYKDWQNYAVFRTQNIAGVYDKLKAKS
jgi:glyoxylase-like metal-dependent hydrolase (beta-lactamase superfamily II)